MHSASDAWVRPRSGLARHSRLAVDGGRTMSNQSDRRKKDGRDKGKKTKAMRESVRARKRASGPDRPSVDETDKIKFKRGASSDERTGPDARGPA
jgi:hypothetical protein